MKAQFRFDITVNVKQTADGLYIAASDGKLLIMFVTSRDRAQLDAMIGQAI